MVSSDLKNVTALLDNQYEVFREYFENTVLATAKRILNSNTNYCGREEDILEDYEDELEYAFDGESMMAWDDALFVTASEAIEDLNLSDSQHEKLRKHKERVYNRMRDLGFSYSEKLVDTLISLCKRHRIREKIKQTGKRIRQTKTKPRNRIQLLCRADKSPFDPPLVGRGFFRNQLDELDYWATVIVPNELNVKPPPHYTSDMAKTEKEARTYRREHCKNIIEMCNKSKDKEAVDGLCKILGIQ